MGRRVLLLPSPRSSSSRPLPSQPNCSSTRNLGLWGSGVEFQGSWDWQCLFPLPHISMCDDW